MIIYYYSIIWLMQHAADNNVGYGMPHTYLLEPELCQMLILETVVNNSHQQQQYFD